YESKAGVVDHWEQTRGSWGDFPAIKRSDASDLARYPKMTESLVSLREKRSLALAYLENSENLL
ncbi:MAG: hypothetical protein WA376_02100, partial [Terrimicrobiaceae bacterium]